MDDYFSYLDYSFSNQDYYSPPSYSYSPPDYYSPPPYSYSPPDYYSTPSYSYSPPDYYSPPSYSFSPPDYYSPPSSYSESDYYTYYGSGTIQSYVHNDVTGTEWFQTYTNTYDALGNLISQTGTGDDGNTWSNTSVNGQYTSWITTDANGDENWSHIDYTNYSAAVDLWETKTTYNDNGTLQSVVHNDVNGTEWFKTFTNTYDASGNLTGQTGIGDDGNGWSNTSANGTYTSWTSTDANGDEWWSRIDATNYNAALGLWETKSTYNDAGILQLEEHNDINGTEWFRTYTNTYDANGHLAGQVGTADDGNTWLSIYADGHFTTWTATDTNNDEPWSRIEYSNNNASLGLWETIATYNDAGVLQSEVHNDVNGTEWFQTFTNTYDANGRLSGQAGTGDDGNTWSSTYVDGHCTNWTTTDANGNEWWSRIEFTNYNAVLGLWQTSATYDDAGILRSDVHNDLNGSQWFQTYTNMYDADGAFSGQTGTGDDGNTWLNTYADGHYTTWTATDANGDEGWSRIEYTNNDTASGQWEQTRVFNDNGTSDETLNDVKDAAAWQQSQSHFDASGALESQSVRNDDGTSVELHTNGPGSDTARTDVVKSADGTVLATLTTMRDGSQTAEVTTEDDGAVAVTLNWRGESPDVIQVGGPLLAVPAAAAALEQALIAFGALGAAAILHDYAVKPFILYMRGAEGTLSQDRIVVGTLTEERVNQICPDTGKFQALTTETAAEISPVGLTPQAYGMAVHKAIAGKIEAIGTPDVLMAEFTLIEGGPGDYGEKGSTRVDIFQYRPESHTVCIFEIKTGDAKLDTSYANRAISEAQNWKKGATIMMLELKP